MESGEPGKTAGNACAVSSMRRPGELELAGALQLALDAIEMAWYGEEHQTEKIAAREILDAWLDERPTSPGVALSADTFELPASLPRDEIA